MSRILGFTGLLFVGCWWDAEIVIVRIRMSRILGFTGLLLMNCL
jgi:hypothetical protein